MVAISMYRGNLHKVADAPRVWRMPDRNLSVKDFKSLLHRRKRALSRIALNFIAKTESEEDAIISCGKQKLVEVKIEENGFDAQGSDGGDVQSSKEADNLPHEAKETAEQVPSEIHKKQKELEEKLQVLNAKKHNLVQVLKQILSAEDELKRCTNVQQQGTTVTRPSLPLHVDVSNDSAGNPAAGETEDAANHHNAQTRPVLRLCGASSSSESPLRRAAAFSQHNMVPHPSRGSPCVGPSQPVNPNSAAVTVSASGTNYIASSPSPAGSGGTSVFRESRLQSPWN